MQCIASEHWRLSIDLTTEDTEKKGHLIERSRELSILSCLILKDETVAALVSSRIVPFQAERNHETKSGHRLLFLCPSSLCRLW
jgi:hypothetical protein